MNTWVVLKYFKVLLGSVRYSFFSTYDFSTLDVIHILSKTNNTQVFKCTVCNLVCRYKKQRRQEPRAFHDAFFQCYIG